VARVIERALEMGCFLEINGQPDRLDLRDVNARAAKEAGLKLVISSDGHQIRAQDYVELASGQARRGWLTQGAGRDTRRCEQGVPLANVLRDLDELIVPALTNWQHPRFFAYFAVTASEPGILAELLAAAMNPVALHWRASPASTELKLRTVDWVRRLLGLPDGWNGHIEDTASTST